MNQQDRSFLTVFTAILGALVLLAAAVFLIARLVAMVASYVPDDGSRMATAAAERIKPVGKVVLASAEEQAAAEAAAAGGETGATPAAAQPAEQIVQQVCNACHQAGVLNAPKTDDAAAWEQRYEQGLDTLVGHAINGFNAMPARGGAANLSDEEVRSAVVYMLEQAGITVEEAGGAAAAEAEAGGEPAADAQATGEGADEPQAATSGDAAPQAEASAAADQAGAEVDLAQAQQLYEQACVACHATGAANAPILGNKEAWQARLEKGMDTLVDHAINGFNAMPAKGGAVNLSDDEVAAIVQYMVNEVQ